MLSWRDLSPQFRQTVKATVRFIKARKREEATIGLAALLLWLGYSLPTFFPPEAELSKFVNSWHGFLIAQSVLYVTGAGLLLYGGYLIWQLVLTTDLPPPKDRPSAIKGPIAFTPADGELFRRLGREGELRKLLGFIEDDQVRLVVLMGASGVGKTSLLRAGLTHILKNKGIDYHYWEAVPTTPGQSLLRSIRETWQSGAAHDADGAKRPASAAMPKSLEELVNPEPASGERRHVIIIDQFEQLHGSGPNNPVLRLLRKVAREAKPPHRVTWVVAFRREFRAEWEDFTLREKERGIYPAEISLRLFTAEQARDVISRLVDEAELSIRQKVVDNLVAAVTVDGEVSPVDIGTGLLVLAELHDRRGGQTVTLDDYQFAGGAEGLLTQYLSHCLDSFAEADRSTLITAMLALRDPDTHQRIAEGRTSQELAQEIKTASGRLQMQLDRLTQRDVRLLEVVPSSDDGAARYRLPHERLIPALHRVAGQMLAEVDQIQMKFENAFTAWKNSNRGTQFLLKAGELRAVERYETRIPWGKDAAEKRVFLRLSRRRRAVRWLELAAVVLCLIGVSWFAYSQYQRFDAQTYLTDNHYPPELYDWQNRLKILAFKEPIDVHRSPWPRSNTVEELTLVTPKTANSLNGLDSLAKCRALKKLTLDISGSNVSDLSPLANLTGLAELTLSAEGTNVSDLSPLARIPALTRLTLDISDTPVSDLSPLAKLARLTQLEIHLKHNMVSDLTPLSSLTGLTHLTLDLKMSGVYDLMLVTKLPALTRLDIAIDEEPDFSTGIAKISRDLTPLAKLPPTTQLTLDIGRDVGDLSPLAKLPALTELTLVFGGKRVSDLTPLARLPAFTRLTLIISASLVSDLSPLVSLTRLTHLTLNVRSSNISDLTPLARLPALTHLTLSLYFSKVRDLSALARLPALTELSLDTSDDVKDLTPLTNLNRLSQLDLSVNKDLDGNKSDLTPLTRVPALARLNLYTNYDVNDLTPLAKLPAPTQLTLHLVQGEVGDLTPLTKLPALTRLDLQFSVTTIGSRLQPLDLSPLASLTALTQLTLDLNSSEEREQSTRLFHLKSDLTPLTKLPALTQLTLDVGNSDVGDLSPLAKLDSCQTLILRANTNQRISLKAIPPAVTHLEF